MIHNNKLLTLISFLFVAAVSSSLSASDLFPSGSMEKIRNEVAHILSQRSKFTHDCSPVGKRKIDSLLKNIDKSLILEPQKPGMNKILTKTLLTIGPWMLSHMIDLNHKKLVLLTPDSTPELSKLMNNLCDKLDIAVPNLFVCNDDDFINAAALSFTPESAFVVIGKKLFEEMTYDELVSTLGHELGHVKCNHMVKRIGLWLTATVALGCLGEYLGGKYLPANYNQTKLRSFFRHGAIWGVSPIITYHMLSPYYRYQENEADSIELSLTHNPQALQASLAKLHTLETERIEKYMNAQLKLALLIDERLGKKFPKLAEQLKKNIQRPSLWKRIINYITNINSHPASEERGT